MQWDVFIQVFRFAAVSRGKAGIRSLQSLCRRVAVPIV